MNWSQVIEDLFQNNTTNSNELAIRDSRFKSLPVIVSKLNSGKQKKLNPTTIRDLEDYFRVKFDYRDLENITYTKVKNDFNEAIESPYSIPLISEIKAGLRDMAKELFDETVPSFYKYSKGVFALKINGDSMNDLVRNGDLVIIDSNLDIYNNNIVAVLLTNGMKLIKRYKSLDNNYVGLYSENMNYEPMIIKRSEIEAIYKVVQLIKNV